MNEMESLVAFRKQLRKNLALFQREHTGNAGVFGYWKDGYPYVMVLSEAFKQLCNGCETSTLAHAMLEHGILNTQSNNAVDRRFKARLTIDGTRVRGYLIALWYVCGFDTPDAAKPRKIQGRFKFEWAMARIKANKREKVQKLRNGKSNSQRS